MKSKRSLEEAAPHLEQISVSLAAAKDPQLIRRFLESILTPNEISEVATRWALVREIARGIPQRQIARRHSLSLCKITRGSRELKKPESAFRAMLDLYESVNPTANA